MNQTKVDPRNDLH